MNGPKIKVRKNDTLCNTTPYHKVKNRAFVAQSM